MAKGITIHLRRDGDTLIGYDQDNQEKLRGLKTNVQYTAEIKTPRFGKLHRKLFALLNIICQNEEFDTEYLLIQLKYAVDYCDYIQLIGTDNFVRIPKSISFAEMDNISFEDFYNRTLDVIATNKLGLNMDEETWDKMQEFF